MCENSSKQQCPECNIYWETGIIYCSCGRNMRSSQRPTEVAQNNRDVTSILGYVKKNSSHGAKHGPFERQRMYCTAKQMLKQARQKRHGRHPTIFSRWYAIESYRDSLSAVGWEEHHRMLYDRIAVEKHICIATRFERIQNSKHWIPTLNAECFEFSREMQKKDLSNHSFNDLTLLKRKENANDCTTSTWQGPKKNTEPFLAVNK